MTPKTLTQCAASTKFAVWGPLLAGLALACRTTDKPGQDGVDTAGLAATDEDGDGYFAADDCDDDDASVHPGATEVCDGEDNDCDGDVDEDVLDTWYADADGDGYGDVGAATIACSAPAGHVASATDCDDADPETYPSAAERCDGLDNDCDGEIDEDVQDTWYADTDGDGYGDAGAPLDACDPPSAYVADDTDCDDTSDQALPGGTEVCDGLDNDCDGTVDEDDAIDASTWYADADGDGFGDDAAPTTACEQPSTAVDDDTDCDDLDADIHPDADEICDSIDNDCDGLIDDADPSVDLSTGGTWYTDGDADGYGDAAAAVSACTQPSGAVTNDTDCDDAESAVNPSATEVCNGVDDDCDTFVDDDDPSVDLSTGGTWYADTDGDGFGDATATVSACLQPSGAVSDDADCDDSDGGIHPDAVEVCDTVDNDCDGSTDGTDAWWDTSWPYRVPVTVTAATTDVDGPPVAVDVDFRAALDAVGDSAAFDADTMRVVVQDCALTQPELPSQFVDAAVGLWEKSDHDDATGDENGMVVFVWDDDGDLASLSSLPASSTVSVAIYYGGTAAAPAYAAGLTAAADTLANTLTEASFDDTAGGLLDTLGLVGSSTLLMSQTDSCCGNSMFMSSGWGMDPQDGAGTLRLAIDGPVLSAVEASGSRSDGTSAYDYVFTYWMLAGRPELYAKVWQATTLASTASHASDAADGIRPWESRQDDLSGASGATLTADTLGEYADTWDGSEGVAWAYVQAPAYVVSLDNYDPYLIARGNDWAAWGSGTPVSVPAGTAFFDNIVQVILPHTADFNATSDTLFGLMEQTTASAGTPEAL
jgi:hypothetical protein